MKKRIRKTGEIVDVISYSDCDLNRDKRDWVSYIDSSGVEHPVEHGLNILWDFEDVEGELTTEIDWEQRRYETAKAMARGFLGNSNMEIMLNELGVDYHAVAEKFASFAVIYANALIAELKKGGWR